jgi:RNA recognition motif-containing protein
VNKIITLIGVGPVKVAKLFTSKRPGDASQTGFVEFENEESVDRAINELNEKSFNGSDLTVKAYRYISPEDAAARKVDREKNRSDARARTAFVSNVAYSVDENEVEEIFTSAGIEVERVSLPKNETGRGRGFGFVTFKSQDDLRRAVEEVNNKNVAGRVITVSPSADRN